MNVCGDGTFTDRDTVSLNKGREGNFPALQAVTLVPSPHPLRAMTLHSFQSRKQPPNFYLLTFASMPFLVDI